MMTMMRMPGGRASGRRAASWADCRRRVDTRRSTFSTASFDFSLRFIFDLFEFMFRFGYYSVHLEKPTRFVFCFTKNHIKSIYIGKNFVTVCKPSPFKMIFYSGECYIFNTSIFNCVLALKIFNKKGLRSYESSLIINLLTGFVL